MSEQQGNEAREQAIEGPGQAAGQGEPGPEQEVTEVPGPAIVPGERGRKTLRGTPIKSMGAAWLLPEVITLEAFDERRDSLFEQVETNGTVRPGEVYLVASALLMLNYDLTEVEAERIIDAPDDEELTGTVIECLIGNPDPVRIDSDWVRSALHANGLDHRKIPQRDISNVLYQLQHTGRAVPIEEYASICRRTKMIREMIGK